MASVNKVLLIGNLGRDPEVRYSADGTAICNISIATTRRWKDAGGTQKEETEWHRVVGFSRIGEVMGEYLRKGSPVYVEGRLRTRKWEDKEGVERYSTEIVAENVQFLGSKGGAREDDAEPAPEQRHQREPARPPAGGSPPKPGGSIADLDDDIPF